MKNEQSPLPQGIELELLRDLERQTVETIRQQRQHDRFEIQIAVEAHPGNASAPADDRRSGETMDISEGGCRARFSRPVAVGDIYRLEFDSSALHIPVVFARCVRCGLLRESTFEAGFTFFTPITLATGQQAPRGGLLD